MKGLPGFTLVLILLISCSGNKEKADREPGPTHIDSTPAPPTSAIPYYKLDSTGSQTIYLLTDDYGRMRLAINSDTILLSEGDASRFYSSGLTDTLLNNVPVVIVNIHYYFNHGDGQSGQIDSRTDVYLVDKIKKRILFSFTPQEGHMEYANDSVGRPIPGGKVDDSYSYDYKISGGKIIISAPSGPKHPDLQRGTYVFKDSTYVRLH